MVRRIGLLKREKKTNNCSNELYFTHFDTMQIKYSRKESHDISQIILTTKSGTH